MNRQPQTGDLISIRERGTNRHKTVVVTLGCDDIANDAGTVPERDIDYSELDYAGTMPERPASVNQLLADLRSRVFFVYDEKDGIYGILTTDRQGKNWSYAQ